MKKSQFAKRKEKEVVPASTVEEVKTETVAAALPHPQMGYDVYTSDGGRTYGVAEISYNPDTGEAKVIDTFSITRLVALSFANKKQALGILKKKR